MDLSRLVQAFDQLRECRRVDVRVQVNQILERLPDLLAERPLATSIDLTGPLEHGVARQIVDKLTERLVQVDGAGFHLWYGLDRDNGAIVRGSFW